VILREMDEETAFSYNNLGLAYDNFGSYEKVIECHLKALEIKKTHFGEKDFELAASYDTLVMLIIILSNMKTL